MGNAPFFVTLDVQNTVNIWDMKTLICGAFGFIGFNFAKDALNKNKDVILLDSLNNRCSEINFNEDRIEDINYLIC
mgnify:CR=1 FL=1